MRRDAQALLKENLKVTDLQGSARVVPGDALAFLSSCREQFDVILLDPPYHTDLMDRALESILRFDILAEHGIMVCETAVDRVLPALPEDKFEPGRSYNYSKIKLTVFRRKGKERMI